MYRALHCANCYTVHGYTQTAVNGSVKLCMGFYRRGMVGHGERLKIDCRGFYGLIRAFVAHGTVSRACARVHGRMLCGYLGRSGRL